LRVRVVVLHGMVVMERTLWMDAAVLAAGVTFILFLIARAVQMVVMG
jgi:hypothetical protein